MENLWNWLKKQPWYIKLIVGLAATVCLVWGSWAMTGCASSHKVIQSSYNGTTGDSITIRYEQYGNIRK